jgi:hypothetical protein
MFVLLLVVLVCAGIAHARLTRSTGAPRTAEWVLIYLLVGYCGIAQLLVGGAAFGSPEIMRHLARVSDVGELMPWFASMYVGAAIVALLAVRMRGDYLIAPVILWSVFFAGATWAHLHTETVHGRQPGLHGTVWILAGHGLVSVVLVTTWWLSRHAAAVAPQGRSGKFEP